MRWLSWSRKSHLFSVQSGFAVVVVTNATTATLRRSVLTSSTPDLLVKTWSLELWVSRTIHEVISYDWGGTADGGAEFPEKYAVRLSILDRKNLDVL